MDIASGTETIDSGSIPGHCGQVNSNDSVLAWRLALQD